MSTNRMHDSLAYVNGQFLPLSQVSVPIYDAGFVLGATVAEQMRTFAGHIFRLGDHLARLARSLDIVGVQPGVALDELGRVAEELAGRNRAALEPGDDLNVMIFVTPGVYGALAPPGVPRGPLVCVTTRPLPFHLWAAKYDAGERVVISSVRQVPEDCWPPQLKCRSRMHYYLADCEAADREPNARAILLHHDGTVSEATTANVIAHFPGEGIVSPPHARNLPGVSAATVADLCAAMGLRFIERELRPGDLAQADEIMLTSTSPCILPVVRLEGHPVGSGRPGPIYEQLLTAWGNQVGVNIREQAARFAIRA